jgi:hypothetical protein
LGLKYPALVKKEPWLADSVSCGKIKNSNKDSWYFFTGQKGTLIKVVDSVTGKITLRGGEGIQSVNQSETPHNRGGYTEIQYCRTVNHKISCVVCTLQFQNALYLGFLISYLQLYKSVGLWWLCADPEPTHPFVQVWKITLNCAIFLAVFPANILLGYAKKSVLPLQKGKCTLLSAKVFD